MSQLEFPQQCIDTAKAMITAYGYDRGMNVMEGYKENIEEAHRMLGDTITSEYKIKLSVQVDFWSQCIEAGARLPKPTLNKEFFFNLNTTV